MAIVENRLAKLHRPSPAPVDIEDSPDDFDWVFARRPADRQDAVNAGNREAPTGGATAFDLARDHAHAYSYKCGVTYIGKACQPSKDRLDQESVIGRLRTDYIDAMNQRLLPKNQLVLMRELLTVIGARWKRAVMPPDDHDNFDGFVVRDLSAMRPDHVYIPTLSLPYAGRGNRRQVPTTTFSRTSRSSTIVSGSVTTPKSSGAPRRSCCFTTVFSA